MKDFLSRMSEVTGLFARPPPPTALLEARRLLDQLKQERDATPQDSRDHLTLDIMVQAMFRIVLLLHYGYRRTGMEEHW